MTPVAISRYSVMPELVYSSSVAEQMNDLAARQQECPDTERFGMGRIESKRRVADRLTVHQFAIGLHARSQSCPSAHDCWLRICTIKQPMVDAPGKRECHEASAGGFTSWMRERIQ